MVKINANYKNLKESYLFSDIAKRVNAFQAANPDKKIIRLGIGDVTLPLAPVVVEAMKEACEEMAHGETFRGYGPEQGYDFLRVPVAEYYASFGVNLEATEIFISDGAKSDLANVTDIFGNDNTILIPDPVYPVYVDSNIMLGRNIVYIDGLAENGFAPMPTADTKADIIYLCSPNNPTGSCYNRDQLKTWVDFALANDAVILYDAAYEAFIKDEEFPRSIYEIEGAKKCAIEFCSLSKTAGFTGTRCGYTVVPHELECDDMNLNKMWLRRQTTKFNGVPYIIQKGAAAIFSTEGQKQIKENIAYYMENAGIIAAGLTECGIKFTGGINSPYIWLQCPNNMTSWEFFDFLLENAQVVGTPGAGFGTNGEGLFRLTAFGNRENTIEAVARIQALLK